MEPKEAERKLREAPDRGLLKGVLVRFGLKHSLDVWGLRIWAPPRLVPRRGAYFLRTGRYEWAEAYCATHTLDPALPLLEAGAGIGVVSCHVNRLLSDPRQHVAVEMNARALPVLQRNRDRNGAGFEVLWGAVGNAIDSPAHEAWSPGASYSAQSHPEVPQVRLSQVAKERGWRRYNLMLDVEGAELDLLDADPPLLRNAASLVVEFHPYQREPGESGRLIRRLREYGLEPHVSYGAVMGFRRERRATPSPTRAGRSVTAT